MTPLILSHGHEFQELCLYSNRKKGETKAQICVLFFVCVLAKSNTLYYKVSPDDTLGYLYSISLATILSTGCLLAQGRLGKFLPYTKIKFLQEERRECLTP